MAQSVPVQPMPEFNPDAEVGATVATRWTTWLSDFEMFLLASGITGTKHQQALLLYTAEPRVREIFKQIPNNGDETTLTRSSRNLPSTSSHKLTTSMKFTGSAKPNKIKKNRWTNSILTYEHLPKIVNLQKTIWTSKSNNKFWWVVRPPESVNRL